MLSERMVILSELKSVDEVITFNDDDGSVKLVMQSNNALRKYGEVIFCNGGDRHNENTLEYNKYQNEIKFHWSVGGLGKKNSSSWIISKFLEQDKTERIMGLLSRCYVKG